jgi:ParB-like chromosome segregation protein Spo0J
MVATSTELRRIEVSIALVPIGLLRPHPLNPRPWSEIFQVRVHPEKVERLIASIGSAGYDPAEPICVRAMDDGYEIIMGHHRYCAVRALGHSTIPCKILPANTTEIDAAMMMLARQGKTIEPWFAAEHAYTLCDVQGLKQSDYAKSTGYEVSVINKWVMAYRVAQATTTRMSVTSAALVARTPVANWATLARIIVERNWNTRRVELAVKQLNSLSIPIEHQDWLPLDVWVKKVILDEGGTLVREIHGWIMAMEQSRSQIAEFLRSGHPTMQRTQAAELPDSIVHPDTGEILEPRVMFDRILDRELGNNPTQLKIKLAASAVIKACRQAMGTPVARIPTVSIGINGAENPSGRLADHSVLGFPNRVMLQTAPVQELPRLEVDWAVSLPSGEANDIEPIFVEDGELHRCVDLTIVDARELTDFHAWYNPLSFAMQPNGRLIAIVSPQDSYHIQSALFKREWKLTEKLIWNKSASDDRGERGFRQTYEEILVFSSGQPSYFGYAALRDTPRLERQTGNCLNIHSSQGRIPSLLAKLLIIAYLPLDGSLYHWGATDGTIAVAGKKLNRQAFWSSQPDLKADISLQIVRG